MYRQTSPGQLSFENFYLPFGGKLSGANRWVKLATMIPWETFESSYSAQFSERRRAPAKSFRMALGALIAWLNPTFAPSCAAKRNPVEFGAKLAVSCVEGFFFIDHLDWEAFNAALDLPQQVEGYKDRFGVYPESVHTDAIYRTRANRQWCKARGIRLSGPPSGRPAATAKPNLDRQAQQDTRIRNAIEGKFG